jgi:DNA-binding MarR family transcriptional regulator
MTDINEPLIAPPRAKRRGRAGLGGTLARSEAEMLAFAELLFFAYRDFTNDADAILSDFSFGRAHHRVLHFVNRHPGLRVADLLDVLKITKQSLGRVLKQLIDKGYILQQAGSTDRRERLLYTTDAGRALAKRLAAPQLVRLARALAKRLAAPQLVRLEQALAAAGPGADRLVERFLQAMINAEELPKVSSIMASASGTTDAEGGTEGP